MIRDKDIYHAIAVRGIAKQIKTTCAYIGHECSRISDGTCNGEAWEEHIREYADEIVGFADELRRVIDEA
jgi:hypothetical protein